MIRVLDSAGSTLVEWGRQQQQQHVKSILIQDLRYSKFSLIANEGTFENQSVLLASVRFIKDYRICEKLLYMKTVINTTGEEVCNAVTEFS